MSGEDARVLVSTRRLRALDERTQQCMRCLTGKMGSGFWFLAAVSWDGLYALACTNLERLWRPAAAWYCLMPAQSLLPSALVRVYG